MGWRSEPNSRQNGAAIPGLTQLICVRMTRVGPSGPGVTAAVRYQASPVLGPAVGRMRFSILLAGAAFCAASLDGIEHLLEAGKHAAEFLGGGRSGDDILVGGEHQEFVVQFPEE